MADTEARPEYCPFCGQRLPDAADPLDPHLRDNEDCHRRYSAWNGAGTVPQSTMQPPATATSLLRGMLVALVIAYGLLIAEAPLLGIIAAMLVYLATHFRTIIGALE